MYSIDSYRAFEQVEIFYKDVLQHNDCGIDGGVPPIVIVGNKVDLEDRRKVSTREGADLAKQLGCHFFEASAKTMVNLEEVFYDLIRMIRKHQSEVEKMKQDESDRRPRRSGSALLQRGESLKHIGSRSWKSIKTKSNECVLF